MRRIKVLSFVAVLTTFACTAPSVVSPTTPSVQPPSATAMPSPLEATATPMPNSPDQPSPSASVYANVQFPPDRVGKLVVPVGDGLDLLTHVNPDRMPTFRVEDPAMATVSGSISDWNLYVAYVHLLKPGGVVLRAEHYGESAEALIASVDPKTTSTRFSPPPDFPRAAYGRTMDGARVITDVEAWKTFVAEVTSDPIEAPDLDFEKRSLVAVVADMPEFTSQPVVTHIQSGESETVTVVQPRIRNSRHSPSAGNYLDSIITLLEIPKVSAAANVEMVTLPTRW